jgi:hypothetical protein
VRRANRIDTAYWMPRLRGHDVENLRRGVIMRLDIHFFDGRGRMV